MTLHIPDITPDQPTLDAAYAYAEAGWYVLPVDPGTKHPGSVVGKGWPAKSTRDPQQIADWWLLDNPALALHTGRSGAVAFDVDDPAQLPAALITALAAQDAPHQSTRATTPGRGHYLYAMPPGRMLSNSTGGLGHGWGEVRGKNGIIVVAPSAHTKATSGGRYTWMRTGPLPPLPGALAELLRDASESTDAATDPEVKAFLDAHTTASRPGLLRALTGQWRHAVDTGRSRHDAMILPCVNAMREARAGYYPAREAASVLAAEFTQAMATPRTGSDRTLPPDQARSEFAGILAWAVAQATAAPPGEIDAVIAGVDERAPAPADALAELLHPPTPSAETGTADGTPDTAAEAPQAEPAAGIPGMLTDAAELRRAAHQRAVAEEVAKLEVRAEAQRILRERQRPAETPSIVALDAFLSIEDPPQRYRIEGMWPLGGRVMLAAQFKAGKTTLVGNVLRSLVDGDPLLDTFAVEPLAPGRKVVVIDDELDQRMIRSWLRDQGITHTDAAAVLPLRGNLTSFDILDPTVRTRWAGALKEAGAEVVILDCLAPLVDALGLSEDKEAGQLLVAFDELLGEAGVSEALVVHHMGHTGERTRGASRLRDWPDVEWRLVRAKGEDGETDPAAPRFLSAYGRDVDVPESALQFDPLTRRLSISGGSRKEAKATEAVEVVVEYLAVNPESSGRKIEEALSDEVPQKLIREALKQMRTTGRVVVQEGPKRARLHTLNPSWTPPSASVRQVRRDAGQRTESECVSASIRDALHSHSPTPHTTPSESNAHTPPTGLDLIVIDGRIIERTRGHILERQGDDLINTSNGEIHHGAARHPAVRHA